MASEAGARFGGVCWVELGPIADPGLVPLTIGRSMGVTVDPRRPVESLVEATDGRSVLVVLDCCEHVVDSCASVIAPLLAGAPDVRVLATSRAVLGVDGELVWRIPSMADDAVPLFTERARSARPGLRLDDSAIADAAELCARLDGLPLAIELAAARCKILSPRQILEAFDRHDLLTVENPSASPRQRTMERSIAWSDALLDNDARVLLRRLSIFVGAFSLDAAEAVAGDESLAPSTIRRALEHLVDHSLVNVVDVGDEPRFRMLDLVREFARDGLRASGELEATWARHTEHFRARARRLQPLFTPALVEIVAEAEREKWDLVAALMRIAETEPPDQLAEMVVDCVPALSVHNQAEADRWFRMAADALGDEPSRALALVLVRWVDVCWYLDARRAFETATRAATIATAVGDEAIATEAAFWRATLGRFDSPQQQRVAVVEVGRRCAAAGLVHEATIASWIGAWFDLLGGDLAAAEERFAAAELAAVDECPRCTSERCVMAATAAVASGDLLRAQRLIDSARRANEPLHDLATGSSIATIASTIATLRGETDSPAHVAAHDMRLLATEVGLGRVQAGLAAAEGFALRAADPAAAIAVLDELVAARTGTDVERFDAVVLVAGAWHALGDPARAAHHLELAENIGAQHSLGRPTNLKVRAAWLAIDDGHIRKASELGHEVLTSSVLPDRRIAQVDALEILAAVAGACEQWADAAHLVSLSERIRSTIGYGLRLDPERGRVISVVLQAQDALGAVAFTEAFDEWLALDDHDAIALVQRMRGERRRPSSGWDALTPTEHRVGELAADGLTNREIATRLLMGPETVKTHLGRVYRKLQVRNRAELASAYAVMPPSTTNSAPVQ